MTFRELLSTLRHRIAPDRPKGREPENDEKENESDIGEVLGPTGGQVGNPQRF